jgi:hypothetical protein
MGDSDYSRLLTKMAELRTLTAQYKDLTEKYVPATSTASTLSNAANDRYTQNNGKNGMSNTKTPLVTRAGEDHGQYWKYVGKVDTPTDINANSQVCWNKAANDPRLFKTVVYTGNSATGSNPGMPEWNNRCYALVHDAPADATYNTESPGYTTMTGNVTSATPSVFYTKLGINSATDNANILKASQLNDIQARVNSLVQEISSASNAGINTELNQLIGTASDSSTLISRINHYMNTSAMDISANYYKSDKRKEMSNIYAEINEQTTMRSRKYRFIFYVILALCIIIGYASYTSKMPLLEQIDAIRNYVSWGWWTNWWIITIVVLVFILSSFGWDARGNIMMVIRYITDPDFWTGQMWWVGVTFLLLIVIFLHATFKSFFVGFEEGMKGIQEGLDGGEGGNGRE